MRLQRVQALLTRILQDERLFALGFCDAPASSSTAPRRCRRRSTCRVSGAPAEETGRVLKQASGALHVGATPVLADGPRSLASC